METDQEYKTIGDVLYQFGKKEEAISYYDKAIALNRNNVAAHNNKAAALYELGKEKEAVMSYDKVLALNPDCAVALNNKALALTSLGNEEEAMKCYDEAIRLNPNNADAYCNKGSALSGLGKKDEAMENYNRAITLNPNHATAYYNKANTLVDLGEKKKAVKYYDKVLALDPDCAVALNNKALALTSLGNEEEAMKCYDEAIRLNPNNADAYCNKGIALDGQGKKDKAIESFNRAINLNPNHAMAYYNKAGTLVNLGKKADAIECYNKAITHKEHFIDAYYNKGVALDGLGKKDKAIECFNEVIKLNPKHADAYCKKAVGLISLGKKEEAIDCYTEAITLNKEKPLYFINRGCVYSDLHQSSEALKDFKAAQSLINLGKTNNNLNEYEKNFIRNTLESVIQLEEVAQGTERAMASADKNNPIVQEICNRYVQIKETKSQAVTNQIKQINDTTSTNSESDDKISISDLTEKMEEMQAGLKQQAQQIADHGQKIEAHEVVLRDGGVYVTAEIFQNVEKLKEENEDLSIYYKTFYWTLANYFQAYRVANTGMIQSNTSATFDSRGKQYLIKKGLKKLTSYALEAGKAVPVIGGFVEQLDSVVDSIFDIIHEHKFTNKRNAINKIIVAKVNNEVELGTEISKAAFGIIECKKASILHPKKEQESTIGKITNWINISINKLKNKMIEESVLSYKEINGSAAEGALTDIALLLAYLYKNSDDITRKATSLDIILISIIRDNELEKDFGFQN